MRPFETITIPILPEDKQIAKLVLVAISLHLIEGAFPSPLPGVKPGIANIIVLFVMLRYDFKTAAWVSILRIFASSLLLGQFLTPTFTLSLAGACTSLLVLYVAQGLPKRYFSAISLSVFAAMSHILGQIAMVRLWLIPSPHIWSLLPMLLAAAILFGLTNGLITQYLIHKSKVKINK